MMRMCQLYYDYAKDRMENIGYIRTDEARKRYHTQTLPSANFSNLFNLLKAIVSEFMCVHSDDARDDKVSIVFQLFFCANFQFTSIESLSEELQIIRRWILYHFPLGSTSVFPFLLLYFIAYNIASFHNFVTVSFSLTCHRRSYFITSR